MLHSAAAVRDCYSHCSPLQQSGITTVTAVRCSSQRMSKSLQSAAAVRDCHGHCSPLQQSENVKVTAVRCSSQRLLQSLQSAAAVRDCHGHCSPLQQSGIATVTAVHCSSQRLLQSLQSTEQSGTVYKAQTDQSAVRTSQHISQLASVACLFVSHNSLGRVASVASPLCLLQQY